MLQALLLQRLQLLLSLQLMPHGFLCCAQCSNLQPLLLAEVLHVIAGWLTHDASPECTKASQGAGSRRQACHCRALHGHLFSLIHHDMLEGAVVLQGLLQARQNRLVAHHESHSVCSHSLKC